VNVAQLLLQLAPGLIQNLTSRGVAPDHAQSAVLEAAHEVATQHDQVQDKRLTDLEHAVSALERRIG
jgi:hypothetical protein